MHTNGRETKKDPAAGLDDGGALATLMRTFYQALLEDAFLDAAADGVSVAFDLANPFVQTVLDQLAKHVRGVAETTKDEIRALVGQQAGNGWSADELAQAIRDQGITRSVSRALMIARTETATGYTQGSIAAYHVSGVIKQTAWLIGPDSCPDCQALNGATADLGAEFAPGVTGPPLHPNCTCALSPVLE